MINGLSRSDPGRSKSASCVPCRFWLIVDLKTHSIFALCIMVIRYEGYKLRGHEIPSSNDMVRAHSITQEILKKMGHSTVDDDHPYFDSRNYLDTSDHFECHSALA